MEITQNNVDLTLYCIKIYKNYIKIRQNDYKSKKMLKTCQKMTSEWNEK